MQSFFYENNNGADMPFPKFDNDLLDTGLIEGKIPVVGVGDKLDTSIIDTGLTVGKIIQLDSSARLPAIDGSLLANLPTPSVGAGAWNLIDTQIAGNSAQVDFTTGIDSTYKEYVIRGIDIVTSISANLAMRISAGGAFRVAAEYTYGGDGISNQQGNIGFTQANDEYYIIIPSYIMPENINGNASFDLSISNPGGDSSTKAIRANAGGSDGDYNAGFTCQSGGRWFGSSTGTPHDTSPLDGFRIFPSAGVLVTGIFKLYGLL